MLIRPAGCRHSFALRHLRLPVTSSTPSQWPSAPARPMGVDRRLLTILPGRRPNQPRNPFRSERTLATFLNNYPRLDDGAAGASGATGALDGLPGAPYPLLYPAPQQRPLWEIRPHNVSSPLIVDESESKTVRQKINTRGVPGDVDEMHSVFNACLTVGKLDRAELILKRMSRPEFAAAVDATDLQTRYLRAALDQLIQEPSKDRAEALHKWYELQICGKQAEQTAETIACMLKVSLLTTAPGARRTRLIDRYMSMAPGDAGLEVLYQTDILNDQDRAAITDVCTAYNFEQPEPADEMEAAPAPAATLFEEALRTIDPDAVETENTAKDVAEGAAEGAVEDVADVAALPRAPDVLGTPQKGMGLRMLKQTLSLFSEIPEGYDIANLGMKERVEIQSRLERDCVEAAVERWKEENQSLLKMGLNTSLTGASLNARLYEWHRDLELRLSQEMQKIELSEAAVSKNRNDLDRCLYGPFLRQSNPSRLAAVTIVSTLSSMAMHGADHGVPVSSVVMQIAKVTEEDIRLQQHARELAAKGRRPSAKAAAKTAAKMALRRAMVPAKADEGTETADSTTATATPQDALWPLSIRVKVGAALLSLLMDTVKVTAVKEHPETKTLVSQQQPAFSRINQLRRGKKVGMIMANQTLVELMVREPRGDFLARHLPMVVPPQPWTRFNKGGFLEYPAALVRVKDNRKDQQIYAEAAIRRGDMDQVLKGLDVLGRTAWKVNRPVFDVMLEAWNTGQALANMPPLNPGIAIPPEPDSSEDPMKRRTWLKEVKAAENHRSGLHSVRCFMNFQMEIARAFRDQTFYFPHNVDFRGRAYPIPPYFNHMGADHVRGLLTFAQGKTLGANGLRWLQVHLSNVFGYDKASLSDRAAFALDHLEDIRDAARHPLSGRRWWLEAEDPWQCLAACFELAAAYDLPDPTQYVSRLPVHQDGTCNGLQHYAALGGDSWGAKQVNLEPGDRPADVYSAVADIVRASIAEDAARGDANALALTGKIKRKVVKQTVMTNVYGVTFAGARKQVLKQLDALYPTLEKDTGIVAMVLASYIATKIFMALSSMFGGAHDIQNWLGEIGGRVCRALTPDQVERIVDGEPEATKTSKTKTKAKAKATKHSKDEILGQFRSTLVWTTPLQMPVVQPYRKAASRTIETCLQDLILSVPARSDPVHKRKQLQAFPPNFIHSLDASHMLLSALECDELGLSFAAVHDSFWTHAADIDTMNRVLRDAFIRIHSEDVVGRLADEFAARYRGSMYLAQLSRATPVAKKILALRKTKRMSLKDELVLEKQRLDLLASGDPKLVARGQRLETPASLFAKMTQNLKMVDAEAALESEDVSEFSLGSIPDGKHAVLPTDDTDTSHSSGVASMDEVASAMSRGPGEVDDMQLDDADEHEHELEHDEHEEHDEHDDPEEEMSEEDARIAGTNHFEARLRKLEKTSKTKKKPTNKDPVQIWLPLTFPPIPAKGDFDVRRLKDSDYFFS